MEKSQHILVIEDDPDVRSLITNVLTGLGYEVEASQHIASSIDRALSKDISLVTLDLNLPEIDGSDIAELLSHKTDIPILVISGYLNCEMQKKLRKLGVSHFLRKPFNISRLIESVENAMAGC